MTTYHSPTTTQTQGIITADDDKRLRDYDRGVLRRSFVSLLWAVIQWRRRRDKFKMQELADALNKDKSEVSRWFGGSPNWQLNTISDIAHALDLEIEIRARDRSTGTVFAPYGVVNEIRAEVVETVQPKPQRIEGDRPPAWSTPKPPQVIEFARA
jgi:hypothetical protein